MAFDINQVVIIGRLTKDPELTYTPSKNTPLTKFSIANNNGNNPDQVSYFDVTVWNKMAEICNQYLKKGAQVVISGRIQQSRFTDKQGQNRSRVEIVANSVQFVGGKPEGQGSSQEQSKNHDAGSQDYSSFNTDFKDEPVGDESNPFP